MKGFFVILITASVLGWITSQARNAKARKVHNDAWLFPPVAAYQGIYAAVAILGIGFVLGGLLGPPGDRNVVASGGLLFVIFVALTWPKTIELSQLRIRQRSWWGGWKTISRDEILSSVER